MSCNSQLMKTNVTSGLVTTLWYWDITSKKFGAGSFYETPVRLNSVSGPLCARRPHKKNLSKDCFHARADAPDPGVLFSTMSFSNLPQIVQPSSDLRCGSAEWACHAITLSKAPYQTPTKQFHYAIYRRHSNLGSRAERLQGLLMQVQESEIKCWIPALHGTTMKP